VLSHKEEVMSDLSLSSRLTNSHSAHNIQTTALRHCQEFCQVRPMLQLIVLAPLLSGLMMSLYLTHIHITSQTFTVSNLPGGFMSELIRNFITYVTRTGEVMLSTNFTCQEHKAHILQTQDIMLISTDEYYVMQHVQPI
jgi:hypothetical protein